MGIGIGNEYTYTPILPFAVTMIGLSVGSCNETQAFSVDIGFALCQQFFADMCCDSLDVVLQQVDILKHLMVDALQNVIGLRRFGCCYFEGFVDEPIANGSYILNGALQLEHRKDIKNVFFVCHKCYV